MRVPGTSVVTKPRRHVQNRSPLTLKRELLRLPRKRKSPKLLIRDRSEFRQVLSYCLILVGSSLYTFVAATYAWMYVEQRLLLHEWSTTQRSSPERQTLTKLSIPKIHLEDVVIEGGYSSLPVTRTCSLGRIRPSW
jgi:hypothetical protein